MCGIPVHALGSFFHFFFGFIIRELDSYLERLIKKGLMVAVCEQIEDAAEALKGKRLITRKVTRL